MVPRKGAYVSGLSMRDLIEVFEIRGALEGVALLYQRKERLMKSWRSWNGI